MTNSLFLIHIHSLFKCLELKPSCRRIVTCHSKFGLYGPERRDHNQCNYCGSCDADKIKAHFTLKLGSGNGPCPKPSLLILWITGVEHQSRRCTATINFNVQICSVCILHVHNNNISNIWDSCSRASLPNFHGRSVISLEKFL